jgi:hypothetical protein
VKYKYGEFSDEAGLWVTTQLKDLGTWTSNALSKTGEWLGNKFVAFSETLNGWLTKTGEAIGGAVFDAVQGVKGMWNDSTTWLQTKITDSVAKLDAVWQEIQKEGLGPWMRRKFAESIGEFARSIGEVCNTFSNTIGSADWWSKQASQWWENTKGGAKQLGEDVSNATGKWWEDTKGGAKQLGADIGSWMGLTDTEEEAKAKADAVTNNADLYLKKRLDEFRVKNGRDAEGNELEILQRLAKRDAERVAQSQYNRRAELETEANQKVASGEKIDTKTYVETKIKEEAQASIVRHDLGSDGNDVNDAINQAAAKYGFPQEMLHGMAMIESGKKPDAVSPSGDYKGLFQMGKSEFKQYSPVPNGDVFNPLLNSMAAAGYMDYHRKQLQKRNIPVTPASIYLSHQQGLGGFSEIYRAAQEGRPVGILQTKDGPYDVAKAMLGNPPQDGKGKTANPVDFLNRWQAVLDNKKLLGELAKLLMGGGAATGAGAFPDGGGRPGMSSPDAVTEFLMQHGGTGKGKSKGLGAGEVKGPYYGDSFMPGLKEIKKYDEQGLYYT